MHNYLKTPNLPDTRVTKVIVDYRISQEAQKALNKEGIEVIKTIRHTGLYDAVCGHPDMQIHHLGDDKFVCELNVYDYYKEKLPCATIIRGETAIKSEYPFDIAYNGVALGDFFFHNLKYTDKMIYQYKITKEHQLINVKQGYTKCSVCILNEHAIITSDKIVAKKAQENKIDALYVSPAKIKLSGFSNGLVGGICGLIDRETLAVNGDVALLDCGAEFISFCKKHNVNILQLTDAIPEDIGSIIPIAQI